MIIGKITNTGTGGWSIAVDTSAGTLVFGAAWSGTDGTWTVTKPANGLHHIVVTYAGAATTDDPVVYIDGASVTVTETATPTGTLDSDAAQNLVLGELSAGGTLDYTGTIGWVNYHSAVLDAAAVNRAKWWGRFHGGMVVYHPLVTDKLTNEGTGTANGTATGSAMTTGVPPVQRPGSGGGF